LDAWKYLNPYGEIISLLSLVQKTDYRLEQIEKEIPNRKSMDFLFVHTKDKSKIFVEILNIHPKDNYQNVNELKAELYSKISKKIERETANLDFENYSFPIVYLPVVWSTNLSQLVQYLEFFNEFHDTYGKELGVKVKVFGFTSIAKVTKNNNVVGFRYGFITDLLEKIKCN